MGFTIDSASEVGGAKRTVLHLPDSGRSLVWAL